MKPRVALALASSVFLVVLGVAGLSAQDDKSSGDESRIKKGFEIAPVTLNLAGKNRALVGLGSYIVNATGGCNDCHTNPPYANGGNPYQGQKKRINAAGYLAGGVDFGPGPWAEIVSRNLTPDAGGRPAGLTLEQFKTVIRTGADPDNPGHPLLVMPWPVYQDLNDHDLEAIYEYLSSIPSVGSH